MQCASCRFENMPGVGTCGRCGSPLGLHALAINVHPPRAGAWTKRVRRWLRLRSLYSRAREISGRSYLENVESAEFLGAPFGTLVRMLIPGWNHIHLGRRNRGFLFLGIWLALLAIALLFFSMAFSGVTYYRGGVTLGQFARMRQPLSLGGLFLGLAASVHLVSCLSAARLGGADGWGALRSLGLVLIMVVAVVYGIGTYLVLGALSAIF
jgi:hypothetical protein